MIRIFLTGMLAAQATPILPAHPTARCRAPDGRIIMKCLPRGTVVKMQQSRRLQASIGDTPAATPAPVPR